MYNEVRILQSLRHPHVIRLIDFESKPDFHCLSFPYYPCGDLFQLLARKGQFPEQLVQCILDQLAQTLRYLHLECGIVHRDVKLENILVESFIPSKSCMSIILTDFGLVSFLQSQNTSRQK